MQSLLEETYPLATEVYRDENGALYVVPDIPNLLTDLRDAAGQTLLVHVLQQFDTAGELVPEVTLDAEAWWGQDPDYSNRPPSQPPQDEIPRVSQFWHQSMLSEFEVNHKSLPMPGKISLVKSVPFVDCVLVPVFR